MDFRLLFIPLYKYLQVNDSWPKRGFETYVMESRNVYQREMCMKIFIRNNGVSKILQPGKVFLQRSSVSGMWLVFFLDTSRAKALYFGLRYKLSLDLN